MNNILNIVQIIIAALLIISILIQRRGSELGGAFGRGGEIYYKKRGIEKLIFIATIILAALLIISAIIRMLI